MSTIGFIIPTRGHFEYAQLAIESAARTPGAYVVVVDDASDDWPGDRIISGMVPNGVPYIIQRYERQGGLSRSWNAGIRLARQAGCTFAVCGNSDLVFSRDWWPPIERALDNYHFAGPVTNAPGHSPDQHVEKYHPGYVVDDDPTDIDHIGATLPANDPIGRSLLNGFCFAGRVECFEKCGISRANAFDPDIPLAGNEDDFFERVKSHGLRPCIVPTSFVFHYRSVSRGLKGRTIEKGAARLQTCGGCEKGAGNGP